MSTKILMLPNITDTANIKFVKFVQFVKANKKQLQEKPQEGLQYLNE